MPAVPLQGEIGAQGAADQHPPRAGRAVVRDGHHGARKQGAFQAGSGDQQRACTCVGGLSDRMALCLVKKAQSALSESLQAITCDQQRVCTWAMIRTGCGPIEHAEAVSRHAASEGQLQACSVQGFFKLPNAAPGPTSATGAPWCTRARPGLPSSSTWKTGLRRCCCGCSISHEESADTSNLLEAMVLAHVLDGCMQWTRYKSMRSRCA